MKLNSCRPKHRSKDAGPASKGLSELSRQSSLRKTSLAERISSGATGSPAPGRRATAGGNVFNRWVGTSKNLEVGVCEEPITLRDQIIMSRSLLNLHCPEKVTRAQLGFEPGTSRTRSANHTPRPLSLI